MPRFKSPRFPTDVYKTTMGTGAAAQSTRCHTSEYHRRPAPLREDTLLSHSRNKGNYSFDSKSALKFCSPLRGGSVSGVAVGTCGRRPLPSGLG
ncbi:unnamed protein product [Boreogadus saida]